MKKESAWEVIQIIIIVISICFFFSFFGKMKYEAEWEKEVKKLGADT